MSESRRSSDRRRRESGQTGYTTCKASIISFDGQLVNHGCLRTKLAEHTDVSAFSRRELEGLNIPMFLRSLAGNWRGRMSSCRGRLSSCRGKCWNKGGC